MTQITGSREPSEMTDKLYCFSRRGGSGDGRQVGVYTPKGDLRLPSNFWLAGCWAMSPAEPVCCSA